MYLPQFFPVEAIEFWATADVEARVMTTEEILKLKYQKVEEVELSLKAAKSEADREFLNRLLQAWRSYP